VPPSFPNWLHLLSDGLLQEALVQLDELSQALLDEGHPWRVLKLLTEEDTDSEEGLWLDAAAELGYRLRQLHQEFSGLDAPKSLAAWRKRRRSQLCKVLRLGGPQSAG
jgi:hypothetical protein